MNTWLRMLRNRFHIAVYLLVFFGFQASYAGAYEDFFEAIVRDDAPAITQLLQRGFDPNSVDPKGQPALLLAVRLKSVHAAQVLAQAPAARVEVRNSADESPLMLAALHGNLELCQLLIARDADVNKPGWTPLHYAATHGHLAVMNLLLENHAYIDAASPNGSTPLMMAARYGTPSAVKLLLEAGADPGLKNQLGLGPLDFASQGQRPESAQIIAAFIRGRQPKGSW